MRILHSKIKPIKRQGMISPGVFRYKGLQTLLLVIFLLGAGFSDSLIVSAQEREALLIQSPDTEQFPIVSVRFKHLFDPNFADHHLEMNQVRVFENDRIVPVLSLEQDYSGVYFVLAINGGRELALRDQNGISVYDRLAEALVEWGESLPFSEGDTWSLITSEGIGVRNSIIPRVWSDALAGYQPDFRKMTPNLNSLESAIRLAKERVVPFGVDKTLLYITTPPTSEQIPTLNALANDARSAGIIVNVWMVGESFFLSNDQGGALMDLAASTDGQFFHYSGAEVVPNPNSYLAGLGSTYTLTYESDVRETGSYPLRIEVAHENDDVRGESGPFYVEICPPNPILVSPPTKITRNPSEDGLIPSDQTINIMVEFPDHHKREIVASRLFVNGVVVDDRTTPPFDSFIWDLTSLKESGLRLIEVEVTDELGLSARTIQTPVEITVTPIDPPLNMSARQLGMIITGTVLTAVLILATAWLAQRFWPKRLGEQTGNMLAFSGMEPASMDVPEYVMAQKVFGAFIPLTSPEKVVEKGIIEITQKQTKVGSDPRQVDLVLEGVGVGRLQAELQFRQDVFWLRDLGSPLGTWVNYAPIDSQPVAIKPGDLIHFGEAGFRFTINEDKKSTNITIEPYQPIL